MICACVCVCGFGLCFAGALWFMVVSVWLFDLWCFVYCVYVWFGELCVLVIICADCGVGILAPGLLVGLPMLLAVDCGYFVWCGLCFVLLMVFVLDLLLIPFCLLRVCVWVLGFDCSCYFVFGCLVADLCFSGFIFICWDCGCGLDLVSCLRGCLWLGVCFVAFV